MEWFRNHIRRVEHQNGLCWINSPTETASLHSIVFFFATWKRFRCSIATEVKNLWLDGTFGTNEACVGHKFTLNLIWPRIRPRTIRWHIWIDYCCLPYPIIHECVGGFRKTFLQLFRILHTLHSSTCANEVIR